MAPRPMTDDDTGLRILYEPLEGAVIDVVAVHGIGAHADETWCKTIGQDETGNSRLVNWLKDPDMLPSIMKDGRIMRYGYKSQWFGKDALQQSTRAVAPSLLDALKRKRKECFHRPLIFIAHSFGGLIVLRALVIASIEEPEWRDVFDSTVGFMFFGTPFRGSQALSPWKMIEAALTEYHPDHVQPEILSGLEPNTENLKNLVGHFLSLWRSQRKRSKIICFYEQKASPINKIVGNVPARIGIAVTEAEGCLDSSTTEIRSRALPRSHFDMNKFAKATEHDFETVCDFLIEMKEDASDVDDLDSTPYASASLFQIAPSLPKTLEFGLSADIPPNLLQGDPTMHIAYHWEPGAPWLSSSMTDNTGSLQWSASFCLGSRNSSGSLLKVIATEMWETALEAMNSRGQCRIFIVKDQPMTEVEIYVWTVLAQSPLSSIVLAIIEPSPPISLSIIGTAPLDDVPIIATPVSTPLAASNTPENLASPGINTGPTSAARSMESPELDPATRLVNSLDETWGITATATLVADTHFLLRSSLASGYLAKRKGPGNLHGLSLIGLQIIYHSPELNSEKALKELLGMYRSLNTLGRARGIVPITSPLPCHVVMARKAGEGLNVQMRWDDGL